MSSESIHLLTTSGAARVLSRSEATVRRLERAGHLPAMRAENGLRLFDRRAVEHLRDQLAKKGRP
jgi:excisionase family DNA binding protein